MQRYLENLENPLPWRPYWQRLRWRPSKNLRHAIEWRHHRSGRCRTRTGPHRSLRPRGRCSWRRCSRPRQRVPAHHPLSTWEGTSTDVSLVEGAITTASHAEVAGFSVGSRLLDIHTVGAGGGSLARFDAAGVLRVGPESAGADPAPSATAAAPSPQSRTPIFFSAAYRPRAFSEAEFTLDLDRTRRITREWLKQQGKCAHS